MTIESTYSHEAQQQAKYPEVNVPQYSRSGGTRNMVKMAHTAAMHSTVSFAMNDFICFNAANAPNDEIYMQGKMGKSYKDLPMVGV